MALLAKGLLPASFRGAPFAVETDQMSGGRAIALHEYPGRDEPWAEDMGRAPRRWRFRGYIVTGDVVFAGGPIQLQRLLLLAALEKGGPGTLTHPTLGILNVAVIGFSLGQDLGAGRFSTVEIEFVESGKQVYPSLLSSGSGLLSAATLSTIALVADVARAAVLIAGAVGGQDQAVAAATVSSQAVAAAGNEATAVFALAARLPGNNGRFSAGGNAGFVGASASPYAADVTVADLVAHASATRAAIAAAAAGVAIAAREVADAATATTLATALDQLVQALLAACADPGDAIRLLTALVMAEIGTATTPAAVIARAFRHAAATALARACASYQPSSYDDAAALLASASALLDDVATEAADAGDDQSYRALRALRVQLVQDLRTRGAVLAPIRTFTSPSPLPALALAQRFYRDAGRADELVGEVSVINPLFMPTTIQALAA